MKKNDLRNGMIVVTGNNKKYLVLTNVKTGYYGRQDFILTNTTEFLVGTDYDEDMNDRNNPFFSIVKVYDVPFSKFDLSSLITKQKPIYNRNRELYLKLHNESKFKVGHIVKIKQVAYNNQCGWDNNWFKPLNDTIGKIGYITSDYGTAGFGVTFNNGAFHCYPCFALELVD